MIFMNKKIKIALFVCAMLFGIFIFVFGGYDDSPGAQGLGALAVIGGIVGIIKNKKKY
jgi:hypothetical protein